jgi:hypothetical protein
MADGAIASCDYLERRNIRFVHAHVGTGVIAALVGINLKGPPTAFFPKCNEAIDRRARPPASACPQTAW